MAKVIRLIFTCTLIVILLYSNHSRARTIKQSKLITKNEDSALKGKYLPANKKIVRVEVEIYDNTSLDYNDILYAEFNNQKIDLEAPHGSGYRARKYFQLEPGKYIIKWKISKAKITQWPNYENFEKTIILKDTDPFIHILIEGSKITVS